MASNPRITSSDFYDKNPDLDHFPGDIWVDLPSSGSVASWSNSGIVITPACDLVNEKSDTLTFLAIVPVRAYLVTSGFLPEICRAIRGQLTQANSLTSDLEDVLEYPETVANHTLAAIDAFLAKKGLSQKEKVSLERSRSGIRLLEIAKDKSSPDSAPALAETLFGTKEMKGISEKIIANSYRPDIHFLPPDGQIEAWAGVKEPSVALFRHVSSLSIELFDRANNVQEVDWRAAVAGLGYSEEMERMLSRKRPMKRVSVSHRFYADLVTRYVAMNSRLGAPSFGASDIATYMDQIRGEES
jgi:hypothetical protein